MAVANQFATSRTLKAAATKTATGSESYATKRTLKKRQTITVHQSS